MRQSIKFAQKSIATKPTIVDMIKAYTVLKLSSTYRTSSGESKRSSSRYRSPPPDAYYPLCGHLSDPPAVLAGAAVAGWRAI